MSKDITPQILRQILEPWVRDETLAAFDAMAENAEIGRRMKELTSKNGFWLSCLDDKVLIGKRTKTWLGDNITEALKAVPE